MIIGHVANIHSSGASNLTGKFQFPFTNISPPTTSSSALKPSAICNSIQSNMIPKSPSKGSKYLSHEGTRSLNSLLLKISDLRPKFRSTLSSLISDETNFGI